MPGQYGSAAPALLTSIPGALPRAQSPQPGLEWLVQAFLAEVVSDAAAGTRQIGLRLLQSGNPVVEVLAGATQGPEETVRYTFAPGLARMTSVVAGSLSVPFPELTIPASAVLEVFDANGVSGGDTADPRLAVLEWDAAFTRRT